MGTAVSVQIGSSFICKADELDLDYEEAKEDQLPVEEKMENVFRTIRDWGGIRSQVMDSYRVGEIFYKLDAPHKKFYDYPPPLLAYACNRPTRKRRYPVNVDDMVNKWAAAIPKFALAHDKDEYDATEAGVDELLSPMLAAPVKQIREFFEKLVLRLKADKNVPMIIWKTYETWHDHVIRPAPDEDIKLLKEDMAREIVDLVDPQQPDIQADIREAMIRALMWRSAERMQEVKDAVVEGKKKGVRPRIVGRESCLFLEVERDGKEPAEIML